MASRAQKWISSALLLAVSLLFTGASSADQTAFKKRWNSLMAKKTNGHLSIKMRVQDEPTALDHKKNGGYTVVATTRSGFLPPPPILSPEDVSSVVESHQVDVRRCYKKQLKQNDDWADHMILDIAIKKSGRVSEVDISPNRVKKDLIGKCLMRAVPKWRFPEFTGALDHGIQQDVMNASIPFSFSAP